MATVPHSFKVCSEKKSLFLFAETEEDRISWRRKIREAVRALRPAVRRGTSIAPDASDGFQVYEFAAARDGGTLVLRPPPRVPLCDSVHPSPSSVRLCAPATLSLLRSEWRLFPILLWFGCFVWVQVRPRAWGAPQQTPVCGA